MKLFVFVVGLCLCSCTFGVNVQVGERSFPLKAAKVLKSLMAIEAFDLNPNITETSVVLVCKDPLLPQVFAPVCKEKGAAMTLSKLIMLISPVDPCEICVHPACFGCFY